MAEQGDGIAVVGMAVTFPGAPDLDTFRHNLEHGIDAISNVPPGRWDPVYYDPEHAGVDRFYCRRGGFVDGAASIDPLALGVVPATVDTAEPDQLLTLALSARAMEDAGGEVLGARRERTGVIVGRGGYLTRGLWRLDQRVRTSEQLVETLRSTVPGLGEDELAAVKAAFVASLGPDRPDAAIDLVPNLAASRIANRLDLGGPAYTVDAACASSLVAIDHAVRELLSGRCDLVIAGGVHLCHDVTLWSVFTQLGALSPSGSIRPFDRRADGLLIGEGGGIVVLERLADALRRDAPVHAVIRGVGISSDGRGGSLMRPGVRGQLLALERAWAGTGLDPASVGLVEAHGTATPAGDAAELATLARFFGPPAAGQASGVIGSVKSMIGHAMPAAGIAGFVKAVHAVETGLLLPTLHCEEPHPLVAETRFSPLAEASEWPATGSPRRAVVDAFGFGGINGHVIVEAAASAGAAGRRAAVAGRRSHPRAEPPAEVDPMLLLAADSAEQLAEALAGGRAVTPPGVPRPSGEGRVRLALADPTPERLELAGKIVARGTPWHGRNDCWFTPAGLLGGPGGRTGKLAFLFPGVEPTFEPKVDDVARHLGMPLPPLAGPTAAADDLEGLGHSMVAVGRVLHAAVTALGLRPDLVAGQSIGEWSGMIATEMIPAEEIDGFIGSLTPGSLEVPGVAFAALGCAVDVAESIAAGLDVTVSHDNCPRQTIICGQDAAIRQLVERAKGAKVLAQVLPFRSGFHTPMFEPFLAPIREALERLPLQVPSAPLWSATTCSPYPADADGVRALAIAHLVRRVRFRELTLALHDEGVRVFVQVGSGSLPGLVEDTLRGREHLAVASNSPRRSGMAQLLRLGAACWVEGLDEIRFDWLATPPGGSGWATPPTVTRGSSGSMQRTLSLSTPLIRVVPGSVRIVTGQQGATRTRMLGLPGAAEAASGLWGEVAGELAALLDEVDAAGAAVAEALRHGPATDVEPPKAVPSPAPPAGPARAAGPRQLTKRVALSVESIPQLADHCLYRQPPGWHSMADRFPVVPMTGLVQMMTEVARELRPGLVAVAVEDVRALRWLAVAPPVEIVIRAEELPEAGDLAGAQEPGCRVRLVIEGYARATVALAPAYAPAPPPTLPPLAEREELTVTPDTLYADRWLFHGPTYQGVRGLGPMGPGGIDGELEAGDAPGALLDNAGQLMGFWIMYRHSEDRLGLPTSIDRIAFHGPHPLPGERLHASVRVTSVEPGAVRADLELSSGGRSWARIEGWEDKRFDSDEVVWPVLIWPESSSVTESAEGGFEIADERWHSTASRELMARRYLGERERAEYTGHHPRGQRLFLLGRIAAKDAVRKWLWAHGHGMCWPGEVEVSNEESGQPTVSAPGGAKLWVSIAHTPYVGVAMVSDTEPVGIDVEAIEPRSDHFSDAAFSESELEILLAGRSGAARDEWLARGWAAKEAVAKALGTGLGGRPKDFAVAEMEQDVVVVNGRRVASTRRGDLVVAWTLPTGEQRG